MTNSRAKGAVGEREAAKFLTANGLPARRGQQFKGGGDSPDIVCEALPNVHFEVKRVEKTALYDWVAQAKRDAAPGAMPVVLHRKNSGHWLAVVDADVLLFLLKSHFHGAGK